MKNFLNPQTYSGFYFPDETLNLSWMGTLSHLWQSFLTLAQLMLSFLKCIFPLTFFWPRHSTASWFDLHQRSQSCYFQTDLQRIIWFLLCLILDRFCFVQSFEPRQTGLILSVILSIWHLFRIHLSAENCIYLLNGSFCVAFLVNVIFLVHRMFLTLQKAVLSVLISDSYESPNFVDDLFYFHWFGDSFFY